MSLFRRIASLARSPQGRRKINQAVDYARSPRGKRQLREVRDRFASQRRRQGR